MQKNETAWLRERKQFIGASDVPPILGVDPWRTINDVYDDKVSDEIRVEMNPAMAHGKKTEPIARTLYELQLGTLMPPRDFVSQKNPIFRASLDGYSDDGLVLEIKCPYSEASHRRVKESGQVPIHYQFQIQAQLFCSEAERAHYFQYFDGDVFFKEVDRDDRMIDQLLREGTSFWTNHVAKRVPPAPTSIGYVNVDDDAALAAQLAAYGDLLREKKELDARMTAIKADIEQSMQSDKVRAGNVIAYWSERTGTTNWQKLAKENLDVNLFDIEKYRSAATRALTIKFVDPFPTKKRRG